ncbi:MAG: hypothetical protein EZS28_027062 [Streblomastix strix]|uniref:Reverse transcriptase domain-containing protein n=1 Tax=Streblomastix strix TaxID=222440 RepID=A0A5J4V5M7_9EUKA|nr:MAG: hypothetical protein EZS28_027062 [Streblomastix strix]
MNQRSILPTCRRQRIASLTQTNPQSQTSPYMNQNQSSILNVDLNEMITNPFSVPKVIQHQQITDEAAQVHHTPKETFLTNRNVRKVASSKDGIVSDQVEVAGIKLINIQTAPSMQLQTNPIRVPKNEKKGGNIPVESKATSANASVVTNQTYEDSQKRLQERLKICPFSGQGEDEIAHTEKLEEDQRENIIEEIHPRYVNWFNSTFIIPKPHQKQRKILGASSQNKEIQTNHFKIYGTDQVKDLIGKGDWTRSLDQKSAFHHLIVYPPHRPYLAFEAMGKVYQYRAMPFGTQHSPIFFAQALAMVPTKIRRESNIRILNYVDDLLLLHLDKKRLQKQKQTIMRIQESFGWSTAQEMREIEPKQQFNFLRWSQDLERMCLQMKNLRKQELRFQLRIFISVTERQVPIKIKYLASIIGKLNFLSVQVREASFYLKFMLSAKIELCRTKT